jgi:hypothetical protein
LVTCIPDAIAIVASVVAVGALAINAAWQTYNYLRTHPIVLPASQVDTNKEKGAAFEDAEVTRLRNSHQYPVIVAHVYFWTPWGARYLDACAYRSLTSYVRSHGKAALACWEFKSSSAAARGYFYSYQYDKDLWIMEKYHFPISMIWVR